ncbi:Sec-independent protein translocase TatB, partial [Thiopseudomonas sp. 4R-3cl]
MLGINGSEFIILAVLAIVILGPEKLPEYTRAFTDWLRVMRDKAEGAKAQFKEETGTDFDEVDWRKYDPRQYDPRRIIRDALREPADGSSTPASRAAQATGISAEDVHGGLTHQDLADMDPRTLFRRPAGGGSTAAAESVAAAQTRSTAPAAGAAAVGGAA